MKVTRWAIAHREQFPRRMEIAPDGMIWIGEFNAGKMARFDPKTQTFKEYPAAWPGSHSLQHGHRCRWVSLVRLPSTWTCWGALIPRPER